MRNGGRISAAIEVLTDVLERHQPVKTAMRDWGKSARYAGSKDRAMVSGLVAPQSPEEFRWETLWGYMQSGPGVFKGDLYFYREDSDFRDRTPLIDTARCPIYLLTGEYDYSCTPEDTERTAAGIPGAEAVIMKEQGHFPMSENPARFREYILPVLDRIRSTA